jgi:hypothetical protein
LKAGILFGVAVLFVSCVPGAVLMGQEPQTDDQKIEAARKRQADLKRQILEELGKQNRALEEELNRLKQENATTPSVNPPKTAQPVNPNVSQPKNSSTDTNVNSLTIPPVIPQGGGSPVNGDCFLVFQSLQRPSRLDQAKCYLAREMLRQQGIDLTSEAETYFLMTLFGEIARSGSVAIDTATKSFVLDVEAARVDKQLGADARSAGTTSLAVKAGIPSVLSWAVENGAAVASRDGTTLTFRVNPVGLTEALASQGYITGFRQTEDDALVGFFRRSSVGFSFDTRRENDVPALIGDRRQLSALSLRYMFVNQRDPRAKRYRADWDSFFKEQGVVFTEQQARELKELEDPSSPLAPKFKNRNLQRWVEETNALFKAQAASLRGPREDDVTDKMVAFLNERLSKLPVTEVEQDPAVVNSLTRFVGAYIPYLEEKKRILDRIARGTLVTFEYTNYREPKAPDLSNLRFIVEKGTVGGFDITGNGSLTFFNKRPVGPGTERIRDFDFTAQLDKRLPDTMGLGPSTFSLSAKYQRLVSNAVAFDGTVLPNTKGDIAAAQIKLTIPIKDSGVKVPFSITFANRTELVREKEVRGNFGFTFDLDTLFAKFKPFGRL